MQWAFFIEIIDKKRKIMSIELNLVLPKFEGPLDLLLHLLEKNEVDIYDIPISLITEQFLQYIELNRAQNIELTSEFIVMAANLLEIKSRMLLPIHDDDDLAFTGDIEDDPRFELVQRLTEYRIFRDKALELDEQYQEYRNRAFKERSSAKQLQSDNSDELYKNMDIEILVNALNKVIARIPEYDETRKDYFKKLQRDNFTVEEKMLSLTQKFELKNYYTFAELVADSKIKIEVIVTFLALLELLKTGEFKIVQDSVFGEINIERVSNER